MVSYYAVHVLCLHAGAPPQEQVRSGINLSSCCVTLQMVMKWQCARDLSAALLSLQYTYITV